MKKIVSMVVMLSGIGVAQVSFGWHVRYKNSTMYPAILLAYGQTLGWECYNQVGWLKPGATSHWIDEGDDFLSVVSAWVRKPKPMLSRRHADDKTIKKTAISWYPPPKGMRGAGKITFELRERVDKRTGVVSYCVYKVDEN